MTSGQHKAFRIMDFLRMSKQDFSGLMRYEDNQTRTWDDEFVHLQGVLRRLNKDGQIIFEYGIPSLHYVIDVVLLIEGKIFVLEYKDGSSSTHYRPEHINQCREYALRLKFFQNESNIPWIIPILVEMNAPVVDFIDERSEDISVWNVLKCNSDNLLSTIQTILIKIPYSGTKEWEETWARGIYKATPTIIKAACEMWERNNVKGFTMGEADPDTRLAAEDYIIDIVKQSKEQRKKSIVFLTGVPGAGKTLVGLGLSVRCQRYGASMLSGNDPLVRVLTVALRRDLDEQYKKGRLKDEIAEQYKKTNSLSQVDKERERSKISVDSIIRTAYAYKHEIIEKRLNYEDGSYTLREGANLGSQHVIIFDEAQRAWTKKKMLTPGQNGKKDWQRREDWPFSEPGLLLWDMNQRDWGVFVCLVGGGQEINTGEAGIGEWMHALNSNPELANWEVYVSDQLFEPQYQRPTEDGLTLKDYCEIFRQQHRLCKDKNVSKLNLTEGQRSIRNNCVSDFVNTLLACDIEKSKELYKRIFPTYKIYLTQSLETSKKYLRKAYKDAPYQDARIGMLMSSEAARLRPLGYEIKKVSDYLSKTPNWFLDDVKYVGSSNFLEVALNEFFVQGLEVDYATVMWDADFRYNAEKNDWDYYCFDGKLNWSIKNKEEQDIKRFYMKNAYRVLLTRSRLGMIIFVPRGDPNDETRKKEFYECTYNYLKEIGIKEI